MKATVIHAPGDVRLEEVPDPQVVAPTDAVVRVVASCVCGSDLWPYRGANEVNEPRRIGHEFVGIVEETGSEVRDVRPGQFVIAPFVWSCGDCLPCRSGFQTSCERGGGWGGDDREGHPVDGGQGEAVRVPQADGTLVPVDGVDDSVDERLLASLLTCSDVVATGWHAASRAGVEPGMTVAVVGDGAVGLSAVLAARELGAERIIAMSRYEARQGVAREFGATDIVEARGDEGVAAVRELTAGQGADRVLECVGTGESMVQALRSTRPGGTVGYVGVPHGVELPVELMFRRNLNVAGGVAPARAYAEMLRDKVLAGQIEPGRVFDAVMPLADVSEGYRAMDERRAIKVMLRP
ncbi:Threonine dehydrogenase [Kytococcus aerolatus]|uniref:Threonine dehydrogenase n=1 Tax=Kytococcus aerolatus TaxID=592308 RepID=A0A212U7Q3_9MICO|nr:zinc-dependent alcohol dehydrogenase family protein [Kytococcus aerolatus]SNC74283.1 Threonine dehydrogenase [Kytococcus aerolatus]